MASLHVMPGKVERAPSTRLEGDAIGQLVASLIAQHLSDLQQMRDDISAAVVPLWRAPEAIRKTAEYEARFTVNRTDPQLHQAAVWKAAHRLALETHEGKPTARDLHTARLAIATYISVLDGSHDPLSLKDYAAAAVAHAKGDK